MHDSVMGVGRCRLRFSTSRSGGETTVASHSGDSLDKEGKIETKRVCRVGCLICVFVLNEYGGEEQCFHSHLSKGHTIKERTFG